MNIYFELSEIKTYMRYENVMKIFSDNETSSEMRYANETYLGPKTGDAFIRSLYIFARTFE